MATFPDKSQRPASQAGVCPQCRGKCVVEGANRKTVTCPTCRGTGQSTRGYLTK